MVGKLTLLPAVLLVQTVGAINQFARPGRLTGSSFGVSGKNQTFDYVVVGGGIAGSVVATRLAEKNVSVALVEAGSFYELTNGNLSQVPFFSDEGIGGDVDDWQPQVDWGLVTQTQINGKRYHYAQGKTLGGSSARNSMLYHWPTKGSYQAWAESVGDYSYQWENMTKYLHRSIKLQSNFHRGEDEMPSEDFDVGDGPLLVSKPAYANPLSSRGSKAFSAIGLRERPSLFNGSLDGFGSWRFTINPETGLRSSAETSFLANEFRRHDSRLIVYTESLARKIIFQNDTATGVVVTSIDGKKPFALKARKEIILSAGVWHSPQLLMVSGIGDHSLLESLGIPVVKHLPGVGQNVHDSCYLAGPVHEVSTSGPSYWRRPDRLARATEDLLLNASGPLTNIGLDLAVWDTLPERSYLSREARDAVKDLPADWPLIEYSLSSMDRSGTSSNPDKNYGTIDCVLVATQSRGNITINSKSNLDPPIINPNWLLEKTDQEMALQAYRQARKVWNSIPQIVRLGDEIFPGPGVSTAQELLDAIKSVMGPIHHGSSSCEFDLSMHVQCIRVMHYRTYLLIDIPGKMGRPDDAEAVVNSRGQVFGVKNLRVVDASSFPFTPPGHIQAATYAHAEKLVDDILEDYAVNGETQIDTLPFGSEGESVSGLHGVHADL